MGMRQISLIFYGFLAFCIAAMTHEALGHGGTCLAGGHDISLLTTSLFRCDAKDNWVAAAGPLANLALGCLTFVTFMLTRSAFPRLALAALGVAGVSVLWECGYCVQAMILGDGDLYYALEEVIPSPGIGWRLLAGLGGVVEFGLMWRWVRQAWLSLWPYGNRARDYARWMWFGVALGVLTALPYGLAGHGDSLKGLMDSFMEGSAATFPLLLMPRGRFGEDDGPDIQLGSVPLIVIGLIGIVITITQGSGLSILSDGQISLMGPKILE